MLPMKQITTLTIGWMVAPPQKQASPHPISGVHWCSLVDLFWRRQRLANSRCDPSLKVVFQCIWQVVLWMSLFAYPSYPLKVNAMANLRINGICPNRTARRIFCSKCRLLCVRSRRGSQVEAHGTPKAETSRF